MLEAELAEAQTLEKILEAIKELITDANFQCNEEGITLQAIDNSHVAPVFVQLEKAAFVKYRCDRETLLGVNLNSLTKILKCAKDNDVCVLNVIDDRNDILHLTYKAKSADRISKYRLKLMDIGMNSLGIPETDYDVRVGMSSCEFARIVRDLAILGEFVKIDVSKEGVKFTTEGESADGNILLKHTEEEGGVSIITHQDLTLAFSLKYLINFSKGMSLSPHVQLMMSADVPLLVSYQFDHGKIHYYLTPRIGND